MKKNDEKIKTNNHSNEGIIGKFKQNKKLTGIGQNRTKELQLEFKQLFEPSIAVKVIEVDMNLELHAEPN